MRKKITDFAKKQLKESIMNPNGNTDRNRHAETIIRTHVVWSMGASFFVTLPVADVFAVSALQLDMIRQLTRVYDIDFAETQGKAIISALTSSTMARAGARSLIKLIPGVGTVVGGITTAAVNGAGTYALGEVFKQHFANGGTILDFDTDRLKKVYQEQFEKGKKVAKQWKEEAEAKVETMTTEAPQPSDPTPARPSAKSAPAPEATPEPSAPVMDDDAIRKIKELAEMKAQNIISEEEFELMKKRIIG
ncbi:DUF697 domain-containing protein [Neolewinella lacunae]|uniref:DUF697 domain-containing protein n=1 Tax=Neolewinella lacunae TaxID=1517758 RepID=A0A923T8C5_9BACT|nr:DUF697 domain-containing protein [Neolewinella lacunae]MBC6995470.1 DUF697 domain-containing protein [Neolewinella lacunae]MDN3635058.1 DUF697 domain-containing protein [Neolewinella lacunae]